MLATMTMTVGPYHFGPVESTAKNVKVWNITVGWLARFAPVNAIVSAVAEYND